MDRQSRSWGPWLVLGAWVVAVALALGWVQGMYIYGFGSIAIASGLALLIAWFQIPSVTGRARAPSGGGRHQDRRAVGLYMRESSASQHTDVVPSIGQSIVSELRDAERQQAPAANPLSIDYRLRYPIYWFGLSPFRLQLGLGEEKSLERLLGSWRAYADEKGTIGFCSTDEYPFITAEILVPPDIAKVHEGLAKQTKQIDPAQSTLFDFLVRPTAAEDLMLGLRLTRKILALRESRSKTVVKKTTKPARAAAIARSASATAPADGETTNEEHKLTWESIDQELATIWVTVKVRSLFRLSTGVVSLMRTVLTPLALAAVLWYVLRQDPDPNSAYLVATTVAAITGMTLPQPLAEALKGQQRGDADGAS